MGYIEKTLLVALGLLAVLSLVIGAVLRHHIGGFLENIAREEREAKEARDREDAAARRQDGERQNDTGA